MLLYNRKSYVVFGPLKKLTLLEGTVLVSGESSLNLTSGWNDYSVAQLGWPYVGNTQSISLYGRGFADLRVKFDIKKNLESNLNKSDIFIYNCSKDSYKILQQVNETYAVQLSVGYADIKNSIFIGDIENSLYYREGPDWVLKLESKDGQHLSQEGIINKSYRENKSVKDILLDMINSSEYTPRNAYNDAKKWIQENITLDNIVKNGLAVSGQLKEELKKILSNFGASLSIQDEKVQIIYNNTNNKDNIVLISPYTGLIGSPVDKGSEEGIEFRCLLIPIIKPGTLVRIESKIVNDYYRVDNIEYKGDTHGKDWECKCEASRPQNINTDLTEVKYYNNQYFDVELEE